MSAQLPIQNKWQLNTRLTFVNRGALTWYHPRSFIPLELEIRQKDLNIEFSFLYGIRDRLHIGLGPIILRKFAEYDTPFSLDVEGTPYIQEFNIFNYGINAVVRYDLNRYSLNLFYVRKFKDEEIPILIYGKDRVDLTVSMKLFGYKKNKSNEK